MGRRILSATDYGHRKVIDVVLDDSIPEYIHPEDAGVPHAPGLARGPSVAGEIRGEVVRGSVDPNLVAGIECHACVMNWVIKEFIFEKEALLLTDQEMLDTITASLDGRAVVPVNLVDLNNRPI